MVGESGVISVLYLTELIIFSNPKEVMCFSRPRDVAMVLNGEVVGDESTQRGVVDGKSESSSASEFSDAIESTLADKSGTSDFLGIELATWMAGVVAI